MFRRMERIQRREKTVEDQIRDIMLKHRITYIEAKKMVEEGQKTLGSFKFR